MSSSSPPCSLVSDLGGLVPAMGAMREVVAAARVAAGEVVAGALVPILVPVVGLAVLLLLLVAVGAALLLLLAAVGAALLLLLAAVGAALLLLLVGVGAALLLMMMVVGAALLLLLLLPVGAALLLLLVADSRGAALHLAAAGAESQHPCPTKISFSSNFNALTSRIVFRNDPAFALRISGNGPYIGGHLAFYFILNDFKKMLKIDFNVLCYFQCNKNPITPIQHYVI